MSKISEHEDVRNCQEQDDTGVKHTHKADQVGHSANSSLNTQNTQDSAQCIDSTYEAVRLSPVIPEGLTGPDMVGQYIILLVLFMLASFALLWWYYLRVDRDALSLVLSSLTSIDQQLPAILLRAYTIPVTSILIASAGKCAEIEKSILSDVVHATQTRFESTKEAFQGAVPFTTANMAGSTPVSFVYSSYCVEDRSILEKLERGVEQDFSSILSFARDTLLEEVFQSPSWLAKATSHTKSSSNPTPNAASASGVLPNSPSDNALFFISVESDRLDAVFHNNNDTTWVTTEYMFSWKPFRSYSGSVAEKDKLIMDGQASAVLSQAMLFPFLFPPGGTAKDVFNSVSSVLLQEAFTSRLETALLQSKFSTFKHTKEQDEKKSVKKSQQHTSLKAGQLIRSMYTFQDLESMLSTRNDVTSSIHIDTILLNVLSNPLLEDLSSYDDDGSPTTLSKEAKEAKEATRMIESDQLIQSDIPGQTAWTWASPDNLSPLDILQNFKQRLSPSKTVKEGKEKAEGKEEGQEKAEGKSIESSIHDLIPSLLIQLTSREISSYTIPFGAVHFTKSEASKHIPTQMVSAIRSGAQWRPSSVRQTYPELGIYSISYLPLVTYALDQPLSLMALKKDRVETKIKTQVLPNEGLILEIRPSTVGTGSQSNAAICHDDSEVCLKTFDNDTILKTTQNLVAGLRSLLGLPPSLSSFTFSINENSTNEHENDFEHGQGDVPDISPTAYFIFEPAIHHGITQWEASLFARQRLLDLALDTQTMLHMLSVQLLSDSQSYVPASFAQKIDDIAYLLKNATTADALYDVVQSVHTSWNVAKSALHSTETLSDTRMPIEHVYAIYAPLFAPISFPVFIALLKWLKARRDKKKRLKAATATAAAADNLTKSLAGASGDTSPTSTTEKLKSQ